MARSADAHSWVANGFEGGKGRGSALFGSAASSPKCSRQYAVRKMFLGSSLARSAMNSSQCLNCLEKYFAHFFSGGGSFGKNLPQWSLKPNGASSSQNCGYRSTAGSPAL